MAQTPRGRSRRCLFRRQEWLYGGAGNDTLTNATTGALLYDALTNATTGALLYDADGNGSGAAVQFATLSNKPKDVAAADFVVVA